MVRLSEMNVPIGDQWGLHGTRTHQVRILEWIDERKVVNAYAVLKARVLLLEVVTPSRKAQRVQMLFPSAVLCQSICCRPGVNEALWMKSVFHNDVITLNSTKYAGNPLVFK